MILIPILFKYDNNFADVGAGHAREPLDRGHGPLLQIMLFFTEIVPESKLGCFARDLTPANRRRW